MKISMTYLNPWSSMCWIIEVANVDCPDCNADDRNHLKWNSLTKTHLYAIANCGRIGTTSTSSSVAQQNYKIFQTLLVVRVCKGVKSTLSAHPHPLPKDYLLQNSFQNFVLHWKNYSSQTRSKILLTFDNWWPNSSSFCCNGVLNSSSTSRFFWIFPAIKETTIINKICRQWQK